MILICCTCGSKKSPNPTEPTSSAPAPPLPTDAALFDFERDLGKLPRGFTAALTGDGTASRWQVQTHNRAPSGSHVVVQLSTDRTDNRFPHLVQNDFVAKNVDVSVSFRTISGKVDASGGLIFRYQDAKNYYVVRANSLEGNVVAYKTENGRRSNIGVRNHGNAYGVRIDVPHRQWNTLRVIAKERVFEVFLNKRKLFEVEDGTFTIAGKVGVWTKADAVTQFDTLRVRAL